MPESRPTRRAQLGSSSLPKYCLRNSARSTPWASASRSSLPSSDTSRRLMPYIWSTRASMRLLLSLSAFDEIDRLVAQLLEAAFLAGGEFVGRQRRFDGGVLQLAQLLVERGDLVERFEHLRLESGFHRRQRQIAFVVEIVGFRRGFGRRGRRSPSSPSSGAGGRLGLLDFGARQGRLRCSRRLVMPVHHRRLRRHRSLAMPSTTGAG